MNTIQILQTRIERFESAIRELEDLRESLCDDREQNMPSFMVTGKMISLSGIARNKLIEGLTDDITGLILQVETLKIQIQKLQSNEQATHTNP